MAQPHSQRASQVQAVATAAERLARCRRLLVLAGAGLSADAGVPTFRGEGGIWQKYSAEELASADGFNDHPEVVWEWYRERRLQVACSEPHAGQRTVALLQKHGGQRIMVATTNEDDLLERAGANPVLHLHGSLFDTACAAGCGWRARDDNDNSCSFLPCPRCGAAVRPGSTWFHEALPRGPLEAISQFDPDGCLLIGSSCLVQPVSEIPPEMIGAGLPVVEINAEETPFSRIASLSLRGNACDVLPMLVDLMTSDTVRAQVRKST
jgi:NAD-dependent deacetylase